MMKSHESLELEAALEDALPFPAIGDVFEVNFGGDFIFHLYFKSDIEMTFTAMAGPTKGASETVHITAIPIRHGVFMLHWREAIGTEVVHIEDFDRGIVYTNITPPNAKSIHLKGTLKKVGASV